MGEQWEKGRVGNKEKKKVKTVREVSSPWGDTFTIDGGDGCSLGLMKVGCPLLVIP